MILKVAFRRSHLERTFASNLLERKFYLLDGSHLEPVRDAADIVVWVTTVIGGDMLTRPPELRGTTAVHVELYDEFPATAPLNQPRAGVYNKDCVVELRFGPSGQLLRTITIRVSGYDESRWTPEDAYTFWMNLRCGRGPKPIGDCWFEKQ